MKTEQILKSFDVDIPAPKEGFKREWIESSSVCGTFVSGYWYMKFMCKPSRAHMWDENTEEWMSCRQYMNLVGSDDYISNEELQLTKKEEDKQKALKSIYSATNCEFNESSSNSSNNFDFI